MDKVRASEAKAILGQLLDRVASGEIIVITRNGEPVAELVPPRAEQAVRADAALDRLLKFKERHGIKGESTKDLIAAKHDGHRR